MTYSINILVRFVLSVLLVYSGVIAYFSVSQGFYVPVISVVIGWFANYLLLGVVELKRRYRGALPALTLLVYSTTVLMLQPGSELSHVQFGLSPLFLFLFLSPVTLYLYGVLSFLLYSFWIVLFEGFVEFSAFHVMHAGFALLFSGVLGFLSGRVSDIWNRSHVQIEVEQMHDEEYIQPKEIPYLMFAKTISDRMFKEAENINQTAQMNIDRLVDQKMKMKDVSRVAGRMKSTYLETSDIVVATQDIISKTLDLAAGGEDNVHGILEMVKKMVKIVDITQKSIHDLGMAIKKVEGVIKVIDKIANQTRLLALNASIEAARLKEKEGGFLMVAQEVKELASLTQLSVQDITNTVREIKRKTASVQDIIRQEGIESLKGLEIARLGEQSIKYVVTILKTIKDEIDIIGEEFSENSELAVGIAGSFDTISEFVNTNESRMVVLNEKTAEMKRQARHILELINVEEISSSLSMQNDRAYMMLNRFSLEWERILSAGLKKGEVSEDELFDHDYEPVEELPGKYMAKYTEFFKRRFQELIDNYLAEDEHFVYFFIMDDNGYVPIHNTLFSNPPTGDTTMDDLMSKQQRFYSDYASTAAIRSEDIYLLQCIEGASGEPVMDMAIPLFFNERQWGIARVGYLYE